MLHETEMTATAISECRSRIRTLLAKKKMHEDDAQAKRASADADTEYAEKYGRLAQEYEAIIAACARLEPRAPSSTATHDTRRLTTPQHLPAD